MGTPGPAQTYDLGVLKETGNPDRARTPTRYPGRPASNTGDKCERQSCARAKVLVTRLHRAFSSSRAANRAGAILNQVGQQLELIEGQSAAHRPGIPRGEPGQSAHPRSGRSCPPPRGRYRLRVGVHGGRDHPAVTGPPQGRHPRRSREPSPRRKTQIPGAGWWA